MEWKAYHGTWYDFKHKDHLNTPGTIIEIQNPNRVIVIGNINEVGGTCSCCEDDDLVDTIVLRYADLLACHLE